MSTATITATTQDSLAPGRPTYREYVGPAQIYDLVAANQFNLLTMLGLREHHHLLDIGCGSLRAGRLFIPYLLPKHYCGIEPEPWALADGIKNELGPDLVRIKSPEFNHNSSFDLCVFQRKFDFLLAQSIFSHTSQEQITTCLAQAKKVMAPDALFAATYVHGDTNYAGKQWVYPGAVTYTFARMKELAAAHGFDCKRLGWPHPNRQTWVVIGSHEAVARVPECLYDAKVWAGLFGSGFGRDEDTERWNELRHTAAQEVAATVPSGASLILVDDWQCDRTLLDGRRLLPLVERDGEDFGPPEDDAAAIRGLERARRQGATYFALAWPAFWWLDHYSGLAGRLRESRVVLENDRLIIFDLRT